MDSEVVIGQAHALDAQSGQNVDGAGQMRLVLGGRNLEDEPLGGKVIEPEQLENMIRQVQVLQQFGRNVDKQIYV